jgi:hypothetical protein
MNHAINWTLASLTALVLSTAYLLDGPSDHQAAMDAANDAKATQAEQRAQARFERAAQEMCGDNAGWTQLENGSVQCFTKTGRKTQKVQL